MVNETMVDDHNEKRIQELEATNAMILDTLDYVRDGMTLLVAGHKLGKDKTVIRIGKRIRSTLAIVKGTAR